MADFKLKPGAGTGNKLILESQDGTDVLTTSDSGVTLASATLTSPTLNSPTLVTPALGTVATGNLSNTAIVYPAGHIVQTKYYSNSLQCGGALTSFSTSVKFDMGTITPRFANSDILIMGHTMGESDANSAFACCDIYKNASDVTETANLSGITHGIAMVEDPGWTQTMGIVFLDPCIENSLSTKTYGYSGKAIGTLGTFYVGCNSGSPGLNTMIIMEIAR